MRRKCIIFSACPSLQHESKNILQRNAELGFLYYIYYSYTIFNVEELNTDWKKGKPTSPGLSRNIYVVAMMQICIGKQQK